MDPRDFLQRLMDERGLNPNSLAAATHNKTKQPQIFRFLRGMAKEPKRSTWEPVAHLFKVPVDAFFDPKAADKAWAEHLSGHTAWEPEQHAPEGVSVRPVAQDLIHPQPEDDPTTCTWEFILSGSDLPSRFSAAAPDDALAPVTPRGTGYLFSTTSMQPSDGTVVIVQAGNGRRYMRLFFAGSGTEWEARARDPAHRALHSTRDELTLLATATHRAGGQG